MTLSDFFTAYGLVIIITSLIPILYFIFLYCKVSKVAKEVYQQRYEHRVMHQDYMNNHLQLIGYLKEQNIKLDNTLNVLKEQNAKLERIAQALESNDD